MTQDEFLALAAMMESSYTAEKHEWNDDDLFDRLLRIYYGKEGYAVFRHDINDKYEELREKARATVRGY